MSDANFSAVPVLDFFLLSSPSTRSQFIQQLQHALINVGFFYLSNPPVSQTVIKDIISYIPKLFALPQDAKEAVAMVNSPHFLGYSKLGAELTKGKTDHREQFDLATPHVCRWKEGDPDYYRLWGPSQWPAEEAIPGFRAMFEEYLLQVQEMSYKVITLLAEAFGLPPDGLTAFYDVPDKMQHRAKIVQYPTVDIPEGDEGQGVGPHYDAGFLTFLLQASPHQGLQVQNLSGQWIDAPPIPGTFIVNIGKALEHATHQLARATSHRVLSPRGSTPRYSVPFFQNIGLTTKLGDIKLEFPEEVLKLRDARGVVVPTDSVNFTEFDREPSGRVNLIGRVKSHPDVAQHHYPELFKQIFPDGLPAHGSAY